MIKLIEVKEQAQDRFNAEVITVETLKHLIRNLNNNSCRAKEVLDVKIKKSQHKIAKKKVIAKEEM